MAQGNVIHVAPEQPTYAVCVLGTETQLDVCRWVGAFQGWGVSSDA